MLAKSTAKQQKRIVVFKRFLFVSTSRTGDWGSSPSAIVDGTDVNVGKFSIRRRTWRRWENVSRYQRLSD